MELLCHAPALQPLSAASVRVLAQASDELVFESGGVVVGEGEPGDSAYLIVSGAAEAAAAGPDGPTTLAVLGEGELFGELALFSADGRRASTVIASSPLRVLRLPGAPFK